MFSSKKNNAALELGEQKKLRSLSREELLQLLAQQTERADRLQRELNEAHHQMQSRAVEIEKLGSLAEASLKLNGVFDAAQEAADTYLENVQRMTGLQVEKLSEQEAETERKCREREKLTEERCRQLEEQVAVRCRQMEDAVRRKCEKYLSELQSRLQSRLLDSFADLEFSDDDEKL